MHRPAALRAKVDLDAEDTLEALRPSHRDVLGRCPALPCWRSSAPALGRHDQRANNQVRCGYGGSGRRLRLALTQKIGADLGNAARHAAARSTEPLKLMSELRGDLEWIAMKALERERERRYATPLELAADLRRYLNDEPVAARPASAVSSYANSSGGIASRR